MIIIFPAISVEPWRWGAVRQRVAFCLTLLCAGAFAQLPSAAQARYTIGGKIVNSVTRKPVAQVRVFVALTQQRQDRMVVITGSDGSFQFDDLAPGKYVLGAGKPGFLTQGFEEHENYSSAVVIGPGLSAENLVFRIHPAAVISGQIVDEQNDPVRDAQVILFQSRLQSGKPTMLRVDQTSSDDRGQYRFASVSPGAYFVLVSARPWYAPPYTPYVSNPNTSPAQTHDSSALLDMTYPITYYSGATDSSQATPLTLAEGDHVTADFSLILVRSLHIHVRTPKLNASQGYSLVVTPEVFEGINSHMPVSVQTAMGKSGEVEISGLAPGQYRLQMVFPGKETASYSKEIDLQNDTEIDASTREQARTISGTVIMQDGSRPPSGTIVFLRNTVTGEGAGGARVSPDGQFQFKHAGVIERIIASGNYEIGLSSQNIFIVSVAATGARVVGRTLEIRGSDSVQLSIVASQGIGRIEGTAVSADDKPIAGAMVLLVPADLVHNSIQIRRDQSDSDGTFTLPNVVPGRYTLLAIRNGWDLEWMNPAVLKPYLQRGQPVEVQKNGRYNLKVQVQ